VTSSHGAGSYVRNTEPDNTSIAAILADTNELQTDWANGGRLDLLIDGIKARTDNLPDSAIIHTLGRLHVYDDAGNAIANDVDQNEIHDVTNKLETMLVEVGDHPGFSQWTEESLELVSAVSGVGDASEATQLKILKIVGGGGS
jgi:hypothetical protein